MTVNDVIYGFFAEDEKNPERTAYGNDLFQKVIWQDIFGKTGFSYHGDAATLEQILQEHPDIDVVHPGPSALHSHWNMSAQFWQRILPFLVPVAATV